MDVTEVRKIDAYLKRLFGNSRLRVVPGADQNSADVLVGQERVGGLTVDDEDDDRSYNFEIKITLGEAASVQNLPAIEASLRHKFDNEKIRAVRRPKKTDSAEIYIGQEHLGVIFFDEKETRSCFFEMAILDLDLEETPRSI